MKTYIIGSFAEWTEIGNGEYEIKYVDSMEDKARRLNNEELKIINVLVKNTIKNDNYISCKDIFTVLSPNVTSREAVKKALQRIRIGPWKDAIESTKTGYRIILEEITSSDEIENEILSSLAISTNKIENNYELDRQEYDLKDNTGFSTGSLEGYDNSLFISESPPDGTQCHIGEVFSKSWTIQNVGNQIWRNRYMRCDPLPLHVTVKTPVVKMPTIRPGEIYTLSVEYVADLDGIYCSHWKTYDETGKQVFPQKGGLGVTLIVIDK